VHLILGVGEILGALMLLVRGVVVIGGRLLMFIFALAIFTHLLHGMLNVGSLVTYFAAAWTVASGKSGA
jgi:hypothetical protein